MKSGPSPAPGYAEADRRVAAGRAGARRPIRRAAARGAARAARRGIQGRRRPQPARAARRQARRRRPDGALLPQQRRQRSLLQRAHRPQHVSRDSRDHRSARSRCKPEALKPAMPVHESDVCVIGGGITAAMLIERLAELKPGPAHHRGRSRPIDLRSREPRHLSSPRARVRRASVARRLHRGSAGQGHDLDDDGGRRAGAALGRRVQPVLGGGSAAEVDVRPRRRLADRLGRAREVLRRRPSGA